MHHVPDHYRSPDSDPAGESTDDPYSPAASDGLAQTRQGKQPATSSPGEEPYTPEPQPADRPVRNVPEDGPSGENTKNNGERGGGLWTSGGQETTGTPYHDED